LRFETADRSPKLIAFGVEENKGGREFEPVQGREFLGDILLNVQTDDLNLITQFLFELVDDGLESGANNSIGGLEFEQDRYAIPDHGLHLPGVIHQGGLSRMQYDPGSDDEPHNQAEGEVIPPFWSAGEQDQPAHPRQQNGSDRPEVGHHEHHG
jgi:hypothetical protein